MGLAGVRSRRWRRFSGEELTRDGENSVSRRGKRPRRALQAAAPRDAFVLPAPIAVGLSRSIARVRTRKGPSYFRCHALDARCPRNGRTSGHRHVSALARRPTSKTSSGSAKVATPGVSGLRGSSRTGSRRALEARSAPRRSSQLRRIPGRSGLPVLTQRYQPSRSARRRRRALDRRDRSPPRPIDPIGRRE